MLSEKQQLEVNPAVQKAPRVAIVHEWLVDYSGSEKVLEQMITCFPEADLYCLLENLPEKLRFFIQHKPVTTSFIQRLPWAKKKYRNYFVLMPLAIEQFDLSAYNIILSSNHAVAKGVLTHSEQMHVCYCHSPVRYAWDLYHQYIKEAKLDNGLKGIIAKILLHYLRLWDVASSNKVDYFIANSRYIARRIRRVYNRASTVIYPPVDLSYFGEGQTEKEDFYLTASRFVPYKKIDIIVQAFTTMPDKQLYVIGEGPDFERISKMGTPNVHFLGYQEIDMLRNYMQRAKAFIFAAKEDFGITPVEAMAAGTPVIAYGSGGVTETVLSGVSGCFFEEQTAESITAAVVLFENQFFDSNVIKAHALRFSKERFRQEFKDFILTKYTSFKNRL